MERTDHGREAIEQDSVSRSFLRTLVPAAAAVGLCLAAAPALATEYNEASCQVVAGTLNIHWEAVGGEFAPCSGIEFTDGSLADAAAGSVEMSGVAVSDVQCIAPFAYAFALSADETMLTGSDTLSDIPMTLTRGPGEDCFVGHWVDGSDDYLAHLSAGPWITELCGDVNGNDLVQASDAQAVLRKAVGQDVVLTCSPCGDGQVSADENCEIGNLDGRTCESLGFEGGQLACTAGCSFDTSGCYVRRFENRGETVVDHRTGLEWERKTGDDGEPDLSDPTDVDNQYNWCLPDFEVCQTEGSPMNGTVVTDFLMRLNGGAGPGTCLHDHCDWRLPTIEELSTLPWPAAPPFQPDAGGFYWSRTNNPELTSENAFAILTSTGVVVPAGIKAGNGHVRAVRTMNPPPQGPPGPM